MNNQVKTPAIVAAVAIAVVVIGYFGMRAMKSGDLDQGQVPYTPGKPPWLETDPAKRGPGGAPNGGGPGAPATSAPAAAASAPTTGAPPSAEQAGGAVMAGGPPPGMSAPTLGNGRSK